MPKIWLSFQLYQKPKAFFIFYTQTSNIQEVAVEFSGKKPKTLL